MAATDISSTVEATGPILRLRVFGDGKRQRYYVAVDDGLSPTTEGESAPLPGSDAGETVTVAFTRNLGCVRWILREADEA